MDHSPSRQHRIRFCENVRDRATQASIFCINAWTLRNEPRQIACWVISATQRIQCCVGCLWHQFVILPRQIQSELELKKSNREFSQGASVSLHAASAPASLSPAL